VSDIELTTDAEAYFPGEEVRGVIAWSGITASPATLRLVWETAGRGVTDREVIGVAALADLPRPPSPSGPLSDQPYRAMTTAGDEAPPLEATDRRVFRFRLPAGPASFAGRLITLRWAVEVELGELGARRPIIVSPTRRELRLGG
jgi:hypothetical protein